MKRAVELTNHARHDLWRLAEFLREANAPAASARAVRTLAAALRSLETLAERGRRSHDGYRELVVPFGRRAYIVEYRVEGELVFVVRIFHSLEDRSKA